MSDEARLQRNSAVNEQDDELSEAVYRALRHEFPPLRELTLPLTVEARDGEVTLKGWVRTSSMKDAAAVLAAQVPGVKAVHNELVADDELERAVSQALEREPSLKDDFPGIRVDALAGAVTLWGTVSSAEDREKAEAITRRVPGVRQVFNQLAC